MPTEVRIFGEVGVDVTAADVRSVLDLVDETEELHVRIDSNGGDVLEGFSIHGLFERHPGKKVATIEPTAFSIASYIAMACDEIEIAGNGYFMLHNPWASAEGDDAEFTKKAALLSKLKADMIDAYSKRMGKSVEEVKAILMEESYFNASESIAAGLADRATEQLQTSRIKAKQSKSLPQRVAASLFSAANGGNPKPRQEPPMANEKKPATVSQIKAIFPKAKDKFVVRCMEQELTEEQVATKAMEELQAENDELNAKLKAMEEENEKAKAKASEEEEKAKAKAEEEEQQAKAEEEETTKAKAHARGSKPVGFAGGSKGGVASATARWQAAVDECSKGSRNRAQAVIKANKRYPGLRDEMLAEAN